MEPDLTAVRQRDLRRVEVPLNAGWVHGWWVSAQQYYWSAMRPAFVGVKPQASK